MTALERRVCIGFGIFFALLIPFGFLFSPPANFKEATFISIPSGTGVGRAGDILHEGGIVRSSVVFSALERIISKRGIIAGVYAFPKKETVFSVVCRLMKGETGITPLKVTIPEGSATLEVASILKNSLGSFDADTFLTLAKPKEGYLFPDTYFLLPGASPESVIQMLQNTFDAKIKPLEGEIASSGHSRTDVITMASLLEKEARQTRTRKIIAGILWKRLALGMPLQVDATFGYIFSRDTYSPSAADLKVDSPYNTYKYRGLPPGPIGNPGLDAIEAALAPIETPYLYYVTDKEGNIYYARTFAEHQANRVKAR